MLTLQKGGFSENCRILLMSKVFFISDVASLPPDLYTCLSSILAASTSWLDHVTVSDRKLIGKRSILYGRSLHDHIPVYCELSLGEGVIFTDFHQEFLPDQQQICRYKTTNEQENTVLYILEQLSLQIDYGVKTCNKNFCDDQGHMSQLF